MARGLVRTTGGAAVLALAGGCDAGSLPRAEPVAAAPAAIAAPAPTSAPTSVPRVVDFVLTGEIRQGGWLRGRVPDGAANLSLDGQPVPLAPDGAFFVAFDRDAKPTATLSARFPDGRVLKRELAVPQRAWRIEPIDTPIRPAIPSAEFQRIRAAELARINAARAGDSGSEGWRQTFIWPATGRLSGLFGSQRVYQGVPGSYHSGADVARPTGTPFVAPADGVVILAASSPFTMEGRLLMIDHGMGLNSAFLHCSELLVREGDKVKQGQVIGRIGMTGRATGPHLHWSIKWRSARVDPLLFAGPMR